MADIAELGFEVDSGQVEAATGKLDDLNNAAGAAEKGSDKLSGAFDKLKGIMAAVAGSVIVQKIAALADTYQNIQGKLSLVTNGTSDLAAVTDKLFASAQRARVSFEATTDLYGSLARSTKTLGVTQSSLLGVTETINKALIISGASADTANGALVQLGQGFASGALRGDELNAVLEGTPRLAQAIADGMGITVGQLRAFGAEGKITAETVFNALQSQSKAIEAEFAKMPLTIGQALTVVENHLLRFVGETDGAIGRSSSLASTLSGTVAKAIAFFGQNLDKIIPLVIALGVALGVGFVQRAIAAQIAATATTGVLARMGVVARAAGASLLSAFGGPVGLAITGIGLLLGRFALDAAKAGQVTEAVARQTEQFKKELIDAKAAANGAKTGTDGVAGAARNAVPGFDSLTASVQRSAAALYQQADAAKKARIELAKNDLDEAQRNEFQASLKTTGGRAYSRQQNTEKLMRGNLWDLDPTATGYDIRDFLSGGQFGKDADKEYMQSVNNVLRAKQRLEEAYKSDNGTEIATLKYADQIAKLRDLNGELQKARALAKGKDVENIDKKIAQNNRKIGYLEAGVAPDALSSIVGGGGGGSGKTDAQKSAEQAKEDYADLVKGAEQRIASLTAEGKAISMTADAATRLKNETDLLLEAKDKDLRLTPAQTEEIKKLAAAMSDLENENRAKDFFKQMNESADETLRNLKADGEAMTYVGYQTAYLRRETELLNAAKRAGIDITSAANAAEIAALKEKAALQAEQDVRNASQSAYLDRFDGMSEQNSELQLQLDTMRMSAVEVAKLEEALRQKNDELYRGIVLLPEEKQRLTEVAAEQAKLREQIYQSKQALDFAKDSAKGFVSDLTNGLRNGENVFKTFGNAVMNVLNNLINKLIEVQIESAFMGGGGGGGGGFLGSLVSVGASLFGGGGGFGSTGLGGGAGSGIGMNDIGSSFWGFAKGDVFGEPTAFNFDRGKAGVMGERGAEAVMPLTRGADGSLGVQMYGEASAGSVSNYNVTVSNDNRVSGAISSAEIVDLVRRSSEQTAEALRRAIPSIIEEFRRDGALS